MRLRIIAGEFKGRLISVPQTVKTRPTTDRVKESIFNYLSNKIAFEEVHALDLYSGSGSLGFEALSRGAMTVTFVEKNYQPLQTIKQNIDALQVADRCTLVKASSVSFTSRNPEKKYGLIIADPPFFEYDVHQVFYNIKQNSFLDEGGLLLIERSIQTLAQDVEAFGFEPYKRMGDSCLYEFINEETPQQPENTSLTE